MQYVRSLSGSVSKTWNSINPATLSGAIDVIVVEQEDGELACSPFHVRFGKFSLLRPYEKKVEFRVNGVKADYAMKLGEGGEAFFVFETSGSVPADMQTSPLVSPAGSPRAEPLMENPAALQEPDYLNINDSGGDAKGEPMQRVRSDLGQSSPLSSATDDKTRPVSGDWSGSLNDLNLERSRSDDVLAPSGRRYTMSSDTPGPIRSRSPPPLDAAAAVERAVALQRKLSISNIQTHITTRGDVMLDMHGYKLDAEEMEQAETLARKILAEEMDGDYDLGSLIGADKNGNLWIYSSEEAKEAAFKDEGVPPGVDLISDGGYSSDEAKSECEEEAKRRERMSSTPPSTPPSSPPPGRSADSGRSYAKTLRLTSDQLRSLDLKPGANEISFSVNRATCTAYMYLWRYDVPIVVSDVDGTITKSDALGHVFTMIGRDWTHLGVAKLYTDIRANGYNIMYLTSRSVGQADTTRNYLNGIVQENYKLPKGPVIMSPDRTFHALRREVYLRKPEVFKMACLRDILHLFGEEHNPFYAGFGNRLTDALSYRSVNIPSTRIFTINSNAEVSLDLLCLTKYKSSYVSMRDLVDHFFPPVERVKGVAEEFTDFNYWRDPAPDLAAFTDSEDEGGGDDVESDHGDMADSYLEDEDAEYDSQEEEIDGEPLESEYNSEDEEYDDYDVEHDDMLDSFHSLPPTSPSDERRAAFDPIDRRPSTAKSRKDDHDDKEEQKIDPKEEHHIKEGQEENEERHRHRKPAMKNDLDRTALETIRDFAEHELGGVKEQVVEDLNRLRRWGTNQSTKDTEEEKSHDGDR
ncbi:LNS2-domain-containing protein [Ascodesmis nigricans]|uniref:LNS2-domain-containing protein n=1 Tax=Ascodesmis nigricans TaxID=341454 RepID=A0A4S2N6C7_9PEZI|nr:LNS2-domain-containing protein [Ascodesmis nigricans]